MAVLADTKRMLSLTHTHKYRVRTVCHRNYWINDSNFKTLPTGLTLIWPDTLQQREIHWSPMARHWVYHDTLGQGAGQHTINLVVFLWTFCFILAFFGLTGLLFVWFLWVFFSQLSCFLFRDRKGKRDREKRETERDYEWWTRTELSGRKVERIWEALVERSDQNVLL